jgi:hypothetical protein
MSEAVYEDALRGDASVLVRDFDGRTAPLDAADGAVRPAERTARCSIASPVRPSTSAADRGGWSPPSPGAASPAWGSTPSRHPCS